MNFEPEIVITVAFVPCRSINPVRINEFFKFLGGFPTILEAFIEMEFKRILRVFQRRICAENPYACALIGFDKQSYYIDFHRLLLFSPTDFKVFDFLADFLGGFRG